jgi:hypothetical protein
MNIFSSILNDRGEMACPVLKDVLNAVQKWDNLIHFQSCLQFHHPI